MRDTVHLPVTSSLGSSLAPSVLPSSHSFLVTEPEVTKEQISYES